MTPGFVRRVLLALVAAPLLAASASAQGNRRTNLTVNGFPLTLPAVSIADYELGYVALGTTSYQIQLRTNSGAGGFSPRRVTVQVRCTTTCPPSLRWFRSGQPDFVPLTSTFTNVESNVYAFGAVIPAVTMTWRYYLSWATDPADVARQYPVEFRLVVAAP